MLLLICSWVMVPGLSVQSCPFNVMLLFAKSPSWQSHVPAAEGSLFRSSVCIRLSKTPVLSLVHCQSPQIPGFPQACPSFLMPFPIFVTSKVELEVDSPYLVSLAGCKVRKLLAVCTLQKGWAPAMESGVAFRGSLQCFGGAHPESSQYPMVDAMWCKR